MYSYFLFQTLLNLRKNFNNHFIINIFNISGTTVRHSVARQRQGPSSIKAYDREPVAP